MTREEKVAYVNAQVACALIEMEGMKADNMQRKAVGDSMAYNHADFLEVIERYSIHHNGVIGEFYA